VPGKNARRLLSQSDCRSACSRIRPTARPPIKSLALRVCVPRLFFFCLCFVVVKRRIRVTIARGHHTTAEFYASACACSVGISCVCRSSAALFLASAVCVITHIFTCALGAEATQVPTITLRARRIVGVSLAPMPQRSAQAIVVEK
jgi:bacterioferritin-associated ferredoxin